VGGELDLLVSPLGRSVDARDQAAAMETPEIAVDEGVACLRLVRGSLREPEVPLRVLGPRVLAQKSILVLRARLDVAPVARENILPSLDQPLGPADGGIVDLVRGDRCSVTATAMAR
jgi:hypothetical protein